MRKKILIVDDEMAILQMTSLVLQKRGYLVTGCTTSKEALGIIKKQKPDLIILDNLLPGKTGLEICGEIKSDPEISLIPILITTGQRINVENLSPGQKSLGPDDILMKPFEIEDLIKKIQKLIELMI